MSWISDGRKGEELVMKKSMRRPSAKFYPGVGEDCILPVAANAGASQLTAQEASWNEHRRLGPLMVNPAPNMRAAPAPAGSRP